MRLSDRQFGPRHFQDQRSYRQTGIPLETCQVFSTQHAVAETAPKGELDCDVVVVVAWGHAPMACRCTRGHWLLLQTADTKVTLVTDGRMAALQQQSTAAIRYTPRPWRRAAVSAAR
jgi:dihydroxyacid dehydratase/phosphogluconate dehydratase